MPNVEFHLLTDDNSSTLATLVHRLTSDWYNQGRKIYIHASAQQQAEFIDEYLWTREVLDFLPHNLIGEGGHPPAPIQIGYAEHTLSRGDILINLDLNLTIAPNQFRHIIEFVPCDEQRKQQARNKFRQYRQHGIEPTMVK